MKKQISDRHESSIEDRLPEDFRFRLTIKEARLCSRSEFPTLNAPSERGENVKHLPYAFTEQGIYMLMTAFRQA